MQYLANTFSPMMLKAEEGISADVTEIPFNDVPSVKDMTSVIFYESTARMLSALLQEEVKVNRINVELVSGDSVLCIVPSYGGASEDQEFTQEEVESAGVRCFVILVS